MNKKILLIGFLLIFSLTFYGCTEKNEDYNDVIKQEITFEDINMEIPIDWVYDDDISDDRSVYYKEYENNVLKNMFYATCSNSDVSGVEPKAMANEYASGLSSDSSISNVSSPEIQTLGDYPVAVITFNQALSENNDYFCKVYAVFEPDKIVSFSLASLYDDFELFDMVMALACVENPENITTTTTIPADTTTMGQKNALKSAENYLSTMAFSYSGLIEQLEYEGYASEEATYAANNCGANWNEQAAKSAQSYLDTMPFSREDLIEQLVYEGFTQEQAEYGASKVGY